jgi:TetR/AcrR family transcriptional regulator, mexJK operon transcriptional repressor
MKKTDRTRSRPGRPKKGSEAARREAILDAAMAEFAAHGFGATTIDAIAKRAGAAKRTLYAEFGGKDRLFRDAISRVPRDALAPFDPPPGGDLPPLRDMLTQAAFNAITSVYTPEKASIFRMVVAEAQAFPDVAADFYAAGPGAAAGRITGVLRKAIARGEIVDCDPQAEAKRLISLVAGEPHLRYVLGLDPTPTKAQARKRANAIVDFFLRALAPR